MKKPDEEIDKIIKDIARLLNALKNPPKHFKGVS